MTKNALAIRCLRATMPTGELLLSRRFSPQRVLQLFTLQLSTSPAPLYSRSETESAPGWVPSSQDEQLQRFEEKSQEPIPMGSWLRSWLPGRRFSRRFEMRSGRWGGVQCNQSSAVFTAFRNAFRWVGRVVLCNTGARNASHPQRAAENARTLILANLH